MNTYDEADYAEIDYQRHVMHTGDGEITYCDDRLCGRYVPLSERDPVLVAQDRAFLDQTGE